VRRSRDNGETLLHVEVCQRPAVEVENRSVPSSDNQKAWGTDVFQGASGEIRTAPSGHNRADGRGALDRRDQSGGRTGAGAKVSDRQASGRWVPQDPIGDRDKPCREQGDIEPMPAAALVVGLLLRSKEVRQDRGEAGITQGSGHESIPGTVASAAAAVRKHHNSGGPTGDAHDRIQRHRASRDDGRFRAFVPFLRLMSHAASSPGGASQRRWHTPSVLQRREGMPDGIRPMPESGLRPILAAGPG